MNDNQLSVVHKFNQNDLYIRYLCYISYIEKYKNHQIVFHFIDHLFIKETEAASAKGKTIFIKRKK